MCCAFRLAHRDQPGNCCQSSGHCEHPAVSADAQVLEGEALGVEATGTMHASVHLCNSFLPMLYIIVSLEHFKHFKFIALIAPCDVAKCNLPQEPTSVLRAF